MGDSLGTVVTDQDLDAIVIETCTNVVAANGPVEVAADGPAAGSAFRRLHCALCMSEVGRAYERMGAGCGRLGGLVGCAALTVAALQSFALGTAIDTPATMPVVGSAGDGGGGDSVGSSVEDELRAELLKVQTIILSLNERVINLERVNAERGADDTPRKRSKA